MLVLLQWIVIVLIDFEISGAVQGVAACDAVNHCLESLAADYPSVKFCRIRASEARLSINFVCFYCWKIVCQTCLS